MYEHHLIVVILAKNSLVEIPTSMSFLADIFLPRPESPRAHLC